MHPAHPIASSEGFSRALDCLPMVRLHFAHRLLQDARLPNVKGPLWRSVLGPCLRAEDPAAYQVLYGEVGRRGDEPRHWALRGPEPLDEWIPAGAELGGCLTLIGADAIAQAPACGRALERIGGPEAGLGRERAQAELVRLSLEPALAAGPGGSEPVRTPAVTGLHVWQRGAERASAAQRGIELEFVTPLRLKDAGAFFRGVPPLDLVVARLLGRLERILPADLSDGGIYAPSERQGWLDVAARSPLLSHRMGGLEWFRYSAKQKREMPFEGLLGRARYGPPAGQLLPLLALGEWIHIGGKAALGFGAIRIATIPDTAGLAIDGCA